MPARLVICLLLVAGAAFAARPATAVTLLIGEPAAIERPVTCDDRETALAIGKHYAAIDLTDDAALAELTTAIAARHCTIAAKPGVLAIDASPDFVAKAKPRGNIYVVAVVSIAAKSKTWLVLYTEDTIAFAAPDTLTHWAAVAYGSHAGSITTGGTSDQPVAGKAIDGAIAACAAEGGADCRILALFNTGCAYVTYGRNAKGYAIGFGKTRERAIEICKENGATTCQEPKGYCNSPT